jgi:hypothetical protein
LNEKDKLTPGINVTITGEAVAAWLVIAGGFVSLWLGMGWI